MSSLAKATWEQSENIFSQLEKKDVIFFQGDKPYETTEARKAIFFLLLFIHFLFWELSRHFLGWSRRKGIWRKLEIELRYFIFGPDKMDAGDFSVEIPQKMSAIPVSYVQLVDDGTLGKESRVGERDWHFPFSVALAWVQRTNSSLDDISSSNRRAVSLVSFQQSGKQSGNRRGF